MQYPHMLCSLYTRRVSLPPRRCVCVFVFAVVWRFQAPMHSFVICFVFDFAQQTANRDRQKTATEKNGVQIGINSQHRCFRGVLRDFTNIHSAIHVWCVGVCLLCGTEPPDKVLQILKWNVQYVYYIYIYIPCLICRFIFQPLNTPEYIKVLACAETRDNVIIFYECNNRTTCIYDATFGAPLSSRPTYWNHWRRLVKLWQNKTHKYAPTYEFFFSVLWMIPNGSIPFKKPPPPPPHSNDFSVRQHIVQRFSSIISIKYRFTELAAAAWWHTAHAIVRSFFFFCLFFRLHHRHLMCQRIFCASLNLR